LSLLPLPLPLLLPLLLPSPFFLVSS